MKTNFKRIGKQSISIVLAVMMMLSTMLVGTVTSNAADTFTKGSTLYLNTTATDLGNERWAAYFFNGNEVGVWATDVTSVSNHLYSLTVPGAYEKVIFARMKGDTAGDNWDNKWNQTGDLYASTAGNNNCYVMEKLDGDNSTGHWEIYADSNTTHKVTANFSNATVKLGGNTLTSGTPKTVDNNTNYTLTVTPDKGYTLTSVKFGDTEKDTSGNYTYNGSSDTTITITTEATSAPVGDIVVYFANPIDNGWGTVCNYIWNTSDPSHPKTPWPGDKLTNVCQRDYSYKNVTYTVYKVTVPAAYNSIIFNNGSNSKQTGDIKGEILADRNLYIYNQSSPTANVEIIKNYTEPTTQKYTVAVDKNIKNGTVTTSATSPLAAGKTFTVTATPDNGYVLNAITVTDADGKSVAATDESTHTYTMPANNVTVSATFKKKADTKYSVTYTDPTGSEGVVSASIDPTETTLAEGTNVTVTVKVEEGYTASLTVDGVNVTTSKSGNTYKFTFSMPNKDIVVAPKVEKIPENTGKKISGLYLIYGDVNNDPRTFTQHLDLYYDSNNQVYAYFDSSSSFNSSKQYYFMISHSKGTPTSWEDAYDNYKDPVASTDSKYLKCGSDQWNLPKTGENAWVTVKSATFNVLEDYADTVSGVKVNLGYYDSNNNKIVESSTDSAPATTYEITPVVDSSRVTVYAKDGTIRTNYQKYADMADTTFTGDDVTKWKSFDYYEEGKAKLGSTITVTTTIDEKYRDKYYVKAFCVNGYSYGIINKSDANTDTGVYTFDYTVPEDCTDDFIEITPIYYYIKDENTVTFYVEDFDKTVQTTWGNTIAVQAWYTNGEDEAKDEKGAFNSLTKNALGGYPGQPLVYEGGKYSMQIPKYLNDVEANTVQGITLNNYIWDDIHGRNKDKINDNAQTYDYDDFYKLSETKDVDNIIFDFRYRTTKDNAPSQDGLSSSAYNKKELENLTDYYGNIVDIFGNILSKDWTDACESNHLTVISNGYQPIEGIGDYATEWSVYDQTGNYITTINCSSLINESLVHTDYKEAYKILKEQYAGIPVKIAYEKSFSDPNAAQKGNRADGRWYFSKKAQKITANVQIEYRTDDNSFVKDWFVDGKNVGTITGAQAYFTNDGYNGQTTCEGRVGEGNFSVQAQTDAEAKYYFIGWYLKTSDGYSFITNKPDADFPMTNNDTYVARFITTPSGTLTLSHTLLDGSAQGKTYISAKIVDPNNNNKVIYSIPETSDNLVIPKQYVTYASKYSIVATLRTVPYGNDTVEGFYEGYSSDKPNRYNETFTGTGEKTHSVTRDINSLFEVVTDTQGNVISYSLIKSNIPFYSKIESKPQEYTITYTYKTRLDGDRSYVIKDKLSGIELEEMWKANAADGLKNKEQLSKAFITKKAPFVSNFREEITWMIGEAIIDGYTATVKANTKTDNLNISALTVAGSWTQSATVEYGTLAMLNGDYLYKTGTENFPATRKYKDATDATDYEFSFWAIFDNDNKEAAQKYSDAVAAYMSKAPADNMKDRLKDLTTLNGYDKLISKSYSKEYNYISYQDYYIVPVYAGRFAQDVINEAQASIRLLEYTRNQWTDEKGVNGNGTPNEGGTKTDYLYTDFALSFDKDQKLIMNNANIKVGITFEIVAKYDDVDFKNYETGSYTDKIGTAVKTATKNGKVDSYTFEGAERDIYRYEIANSAISNKNRIECYLRFKNTANARQNVFKVYSYIYDTNSGDIYLSAPVYMNMYDIGTLTYIAPDLASTNLQPAG